MPVTHKFCANTHTRTYTYINIFSKQTRTQTHTPIHINISIYNVATHCTTLQDRCRTSRLAGLTPSSPPAQSFTFHRSVSVLKLVYSCVGGLRVYTYTREHEYKLFLRAYFPRVRSASDCGVYSMTYAFDNALVNTVMFTRLGNIVYYLCKHSDHRFFPYCTNTSS